jgi:hypothetical protein
VHLTYHGLRPISVEETEHFRMMRAFWSNPDAFVKDALAEAEDEEAEGDEGEENADED